MYQAKNIQEFAELCMTSNAWVYFVTEVIHEVIWANTAVLLRNEDRRIINVYANLKTRSWSVFKSYFPEIQKLNNEFHLNCSLTDVYLFMLKSTDEKDWWRELISCINHWLSGQYIIASQINPNLE